MLRGILLISPEAWKASNFAYRTSLEGHLADIISKVFTQNLHEEMAEEDRAQVQTLDSIVLAPCSMLVQVYASHTPDRGHDNNRIVVRRLLEKEVERLFPPRVIRVQVVLTILAPG